VTFESLIEPVPEAWRLTTLGEACSRGGGCIQTGPFGSQLHAADYVVGGIPSVMPQNIGENRIDTHGIAGISVSDAKRLQRYLLKAGDIVYSRRGDVERRALVRDQEEGWLCGTGCLRVRFGHGNVDPLFASYQLAHPEVRAWIVRHAIGATMPNLNTSILSALPFLLPPLPEQRTIAGILGALDDKIELNRQMNETLEAMARAIFKSWFVDFDPSRAKAEDRQPVGMDAETAALFSDSFEETEFGRVPKGWEIGPLGRFFTVGLGGAWGNDEASARSSVAVRCLRGIDCHDLAEGRLPDVPVRWISESQVADRALADGVILIEGSGSFCGRSLLWHSSYGRLIGEPVAYSNFCKRLNPLRTPSQAAVCWLSMRSVYRDGGLQAFRTGTAFPNLDVSGLLANLVVVVPPEAVARQFGRFFEVSRRVDLIAQSGTLAAVRDLLLPKLLSGEVRAGPLGTGKPDSGL
jgi:type I restriction enzyme, S subunit